MNGLTQEIGTRFRGVRRCVSQRAAPIAFLVMIVSSAFVSLMAQTPQAAPSGPAACGSLS